MAAALDHVQVMMPNGAEDDARAFYAGLLGLTEIGSPSRCAQAAACGSPRGIHVSGEEGSRRLAGRTRRCASRTLDRLAGVLAAAGCTVEWDERWPAVRRFYTRDPFGNRVELLA